MSEVAEPSRFDELRDGEGLVRPHWRAFARTLQQLSPEEFARRQASARLAITRQDPSGPRARSAV